MKTGKTTQPAAKVQPNPDQHSFRFRSATGKWLTDEIAYIESLAANRLRAGVSFASVQTGALALLKIAMEGVAGELVPASATATLFPACTPAADSSRYAQPEGLTQ